MLLNLLADQFREVGIGEAALYALLGYLIVFLGIAFLIFVVWLVGRIISSKQQASAPVKKETVKETKKLTNHLTKAKSNIFHTL